MKTAKELLQFYWGYPSFRKPQEEIINAISHGEDVLALLPTGGGKSLCYQIPALLTDGIALVISPLIALMQDQVSALLEKGIKATWIRPGMNSQEIVQLFDNLKFTKTKLLYVSPERLQSRLVQEKLKELNIAFIAVDEAHCISEWGHDFRPSYRKILDTANQLDRPPIIALTATATQKVCKDIIASLEMSPVSRFQKSFARTNIAYQLFQVENKQERLLQIAKKMKGPIIVYTNRRAHTREIAHMFERHGHSASCYHGGLTADEKKLAFNEWMVEKKRIMVATNAFGMGIDKNNVEVVVHVNMPQSLENYFQEAGRAGRGGNKAFSVFLWNNHDLLQFQKQTAEALPSIEFVGDLTRKLYEYFDVAIGELPDTYYAFDWIDFCHRYSFSLNKAKTTLQLLHTNSVVEISPNYSDSATVQILMDTDKLYPQLHSEQYRLLLEVLLRSYTGLFSNPSAIDLYKIAAKLGVTSDTVKHNLEHMHAMNWIDFVPSMGKQMLQFMQPREDRYTIRRISKELKTYLQHKKNTSQSLVKFVQSEEICRSQWLLHYFGESHSEACGLCDVCIQNKPIPPNLASKIIALLAERARNSQELCTLLDAQERWVLKTLRQLLKEEKIQLNKNNQYCIPNEA